MPPKKRKSKHKRKPKRLWLKTGPKPLPFEGDVEEVRPVCRKGHIIFDAAKDLGPKGQCRRCNNERQKKWQKRNPEKYASMQAKYKHERLVKDFKASATDHAFFNWTVEE